MLLALHGLARRLETVAALAQQPRDGLVADADPVFREHLGGQRVRALVRPAQRRLWIPARRWGDELLECRNEFWMHGFVASSATALAPNLHDVVCARTAAHFRPTESHGADRQSGRTCYRRDPTPAHRVGFGTGPQTTRAFIHRRCQQAPFPPDQLLGVHSKRRSRRRDPVDPKSTAFDRLVQTRALSPRGAPS
jgi:hypothetical protein